MWADLTRLLLALKAAPEAVLGPSTSSNGSDACLAPAALRARREILEGVDEAVCAFLKLGDVEGIHNCAVLAWNAGGPPCVLRTLILLLRGHVLRCQCSFYFLCSTHAILSISTPATGRLLRKTLHSWVCMHMHWCELQLLTMPRHCTCLLAPPHPSPRPAVAAAVSSEPGEAGIHCSCKGTGGSG